MCGVLLFAARSTSTTLKITHLPSGETCGSPTRFSFIMSSKVKGCLAWAVAGSAEARTRRERRRRRMKYLLRQTDECSTSILRLRVAAAPFCHPEPRGLAAKDLCNLPAAGVLPTKLHRSFAAIQSRSG